MKNLIDPGFVCINSDNRIMYEASSIDDGKHYIGHNTKYKLVICDFSDRTLYSFDGYKKSANGIDLYGLKYIGKIKIQ